MRDIVRRRRVDVEVYVIRKFRSETMKRESENIDAGVWTFELINYHSQCGHGGWQEAK